MTLPKNPEGALRTRKLDNKKHVHVYHFDQIDETQTTYVQLVATGVDKEEEDEVHLQAALTTQSDIPVPNASKPSLTYDSCYKPTFIQPINLIKFQDVFDHVIGVQYNIDQSDSVWLKNVDINVLDFEELMASMELLANESITVDCFDLAGFKSFLEVIQPRLLSLEAHFPAVYQYWKKKRFKSGISKRIIPTLKFDETIEDNDPYVCFRRREVKSTRKTRRCDQLSLDKLRKLHDEMIRAREILNLIVERERIRKEMILYDVEIFQTRIKVRAFKRILGIAPSLVDVDASPEKRKKRVMVPEPEKLKLPVQRFKDLFSPGLNEGASIEDKIKRRKLLDEREGWLDLTEAPYVGIPVNYEDEFWTNKIPVSFKNSPTTKEIVPPAFLLRRRIGRGGRVIYDRHQSNLNLDPKWKFDNYDEDVDEMIVEMQEDPRFILFRAFNLAPSSEQECRSLMNKPYFPDQINVVPITREQRLANQAALAAAAPQVVVAPPPKKRPPRTNEQKNIKKKVVPELDPRQAAVKAFLAASQKQASQNTVNPPSQFIRPSGSPDAFNVPILPQQNASSPPRNVRPPASMNWQYQGARGVTSQQQQQMMFFQAQQAQQALIQQNIGSSTPKVSPNTKP